MKFMVSRTSKYDDDVSPCENAVKEKYNYIEVRTLNSPEQFDAKFARSEGRWLSKGINHCINEKGYIQREHVEYFDGWFMEINSLDELMAFTNKHGKVVIRKCLFNKNIDEIEIYDTYRE